MRAFDCAPRGLADGEVVDLSDFLGNAAEEEEEESVEAASAAAAVADELSAKDGE